MADWRAQWVYVLIGGFGLGALWRSFFDFGFAFSVFVVLLAVSVALVYVFRRDKRVFVAAIFLLGAALGVVRFDISALNQGSVELDALVGTRIVAEGIIVDEPDLRENSVQLTVRIERVNDTSVDAKVRVVADLFPRFTYGDRVHLSGALERPSAFITDENRYFDYAAFLGKDNIFYQMFFPDVTVLGGAGGNLVKRTLFAVKNAFLERIARVIPEPQASLLGGLVVGAKQSLGESLLADFRTTGIIHIVVLSGYNITIVIEFIKRIFSRLGGTITNVGSVVAIALFVIMTGASATAVRAGIMGGLIILARSTGRTYDMVRALFIAGFFMVLHNPKILVFDTSFQLSFVATLGLIYLAPRLEQYFGWMPSKWQFREFATATIATQLFVLPILIYKMGELSLVALPVNLLILGVVPITMLLGFLTGAIGFASTILSLPFAWITSAFLSYQLIVVDFFARLPFSAVRIETFPLWAALGLYVVLGFTLWHAHTRKEVIARD